MKLIVGLGNPGAEYSNTRHNLGFFIVDKIAEHFGVRLSHSSSFEGALGNGAVFNCRCMIFKPQTFMNLSGRAVAKLVSYYKLDPEDVIVIHDDLDLDEGRVKLKESGGHGGHNGIRSLINCLGGGQFYRIKVGIGRPSDVVNESNVSDWVLNKFSKNSPITNSDCFDRVLERLKCFLSAKNS